MTDIDIDFADRSHAIDGLRCIRAVKVKGGKRQALSSGMYFHDIPIDPFDRMAIWDHKLAAEKGYFKVDLLNNSIYSKVRNEEHLITLLTDEPPWDAFADPLIVDQLAHLKGNFDIVAQIQPQNIEDLAVCLALIRPAKRSLIGKPRAEIDANIWLTTTAHYFKRAHAIAYAVSIVVQLNLLIEQIQKESH